MELDTFAMRLGTFALKLDKFAQESIIARMTSWNKDKNKM